MFIEGFAWLGVDGILSPEVAHDMGAALMLYAQGLLPFLVPMSVLLFEPNAKSWQRMPPFVLLGEQQRSNILWALTAFPLELYVKGNSIVYINQATNNTAVAVLYVIATCGALFFSEIRMMVILGAVNLMILLVVMAVKRCAFTSRSIRFNNVQAGTPVEQHYREAQRGSRIQWRSRTGLTDS